MTNDSQSITRRILDADPPTSKFTNAVWISVAMMLCSLSFIVSLAVAVESGEFEQLAEFSSTYYWASTLIIFGAWLRPISVLVEKVMNALRDELDVGHHLLIVLLFWMLCTAGFMPQPGTDIAPAAGPILGIVGAFFTASESSTRLIEYGLGRLGIDVTDKQKQPTQRSVRERYMDGEITEDELEDELEEVVARE